MGSISLQRAHGFAGRPKIPGDKSISHRALIFGALAQGVSRVYGLLDSEDVRSTRNCLESLGVTIRARSHSEVEIEGRGLRGLKAPAGPLDCGNSGTTFRLFMGMLAGQSFESTLVGDASLSRRPMKRVAEPLTKMGARIELTGGNFPPVRILDSDGSLQPTQYELPIASAQVKSALLLAGLFADGTTVLSGKIQSRDHTERLLRYLGVPLEITGGQIAIRGGQTLQAAELRVPGDFSTAAFWLTAAAVIQGADIRMEGISLNPTRLGFLRVLQRMGAAIETELRETAPEPWGTIWARHSSLRGTTILAEEVPDLIDELPTLAVIATQAEGVTEVRGARELRVKESDRLEAIGRALRAMGAELTLFEDGFSIAGPQRLRGAKIDSEGDHRIAMAFSIAALVADGTTEILGSECVSVSYPGFYETLGECCR